MKSFILIVAFQISATTILFSQKVNDLDKKNLIEFYFPISHFFDETKTNWILLTPYKSNYVYDNSGNLIDYNVKYILPATVGIQYTRNFKFASQIRLSILRYSMDYGYDRQKIKGEVIKRNYGLFSFGYLNEFMSNNKIGVSLLGEINYRSGTETIHIYYPNWFEGRAESIDLKDLGLSGGLKIERTLFYNILISGEAKYTRFLYRYSEGIDFFGQHKKATPNTLTLKLGIGYQF